jgi:hypothetical protein
VTITLHTPRLPVAALIAAVALVFLHHVRAAVPLAGSVPIPVLMLAAGLTVCAIGAAVAVWLVLAYRGA